MSFDVPDDVHYQDSHEWVRMTDGTARIGISDFAQDELGDIVFVELPEIGETVEAGASFGIIESIKAVSDLYAPVGGEVADRNDELEAAPERVNDDPYGDGWLIEIDVADESELDELLDADSYREQIE